MTKNVLLYILLSVSIIANVAYLAHYHIHNPEFKIGDHVTNGNCDGYIAGLTGEEAYFVEFNCGLFYFSKAYVKLSTLKLIEKEQK